MADEVSKQTIIITAEDNATSTLRSIEATAIGGAKRIESAFVTAETGKIAAAEGTFQAQNALLIKAQGAHTAALARQSAAQTTANEAQVVSATARAEATSAIAKVESDVILGHWAKRAGRVAEFEALSTSYVADAAAAQTAIVEAAEAKKTAKSLSAAAARAAIPAQQTALELAAVEAQIAIFEGKLVAEQATFDSELIATARNAAAKVAAAQAGEIAHTKSVADGVSQRQMILNVGNAAYAASAAETADVVLSKEYAMTAVRTAMTKNAAATQGAIVTASYQQQLITAVANQTAITGAVIVGEEARAAARVKGATKELAAVEAGLAAQKFATDAHASARVAAHVGMVAALAALEDIPKAAVVLSYEEQLKAVVVAQAAQTIAVKAGVEARTLAIATGATQQAAAQAAGMAAMNAALVAGATPAVAQALGLKAASAAMASFEVDAAKALKGAALAAATHGPVVEGWTGRLGSSFLRTGNQARTASDEMVHFLRAAGGFQNLSLSGAATIGSNLGAVGIAAAIATITVTGLLYAVKKFADVAGDVTNLRIGFETLTSRVGESSDAFLNKMRPASMGLVSDMQLMKSTNEAILLGIPVSSDAMAELTRGAVLLGRTMGVDALKSVNSLIEGIGRQSPRLLDNIGIIVRAKEVYKAYADQIGVAVDELTDQDRKTAFLAATLDSIRLKTENLIAPTKTFADSVHQLWIQIVNATKANLDYINIALGGTQLDAEIARLNSASGARYEEVKAIESQVSALKRLQEQRMLDQYKQVVATKGEAPLPEPPPIPESEQTFTQKQVAVLGEFPYIPGIANANQLIAAYRAELDNLKETNFQLAPASEQATRALARFNIATEQIRVLDKARDIELLGKVMYEFYAGDPVREYEDNQKTVAAVNEWVDDALRDREQKVAKLEEVTRRINDTSTPQGEIPRLKELQQSLTPKVPHDTANDRRLADEAKYQEMLDAIRVKAADKWSVEQEALSKTALQHKFDNEIAEAKRRDAGVAAIDNLRLAKDIAIQENTQNMTRGRALNEIETNKLVLEAKSRAFQLSDEESLNLSIANSRARADADLLAATENPPKRKAIEEALQRDIDAIAMKHAATRSIKEIEYAADAAKAISTLKLFSLESDKISAAPPIDPKIKPGAERDLVEKAQQDAVLKIDLDIIAEEYKAAERLALDHYAVEFSQDKATYESKKAALAKYLNDIAIAKAIARLAEQKANAIANALDVARDKDATALKIANAQLVLGAVGGLAQAAIKNSKKAAIANVIISTAIGVMKAWELGPYVGPIMAALIVATGALQIAKINSSDTASSVSGGGTSGNANVPNPTDTSKTVGTGNNTVLGPGAKPWVPPPAPVPPSTNPFHPYPQALVTPPAPAVPASVQPKAVAPPPVVVPALDSAPSASVVNEFSAPTYQAPTYQAPTFTAPIYQAPTIATPRPTATAPDVPAVVHHHAAANYAFTVNAVDARSFKAFIDEPDNRRAIAETYEAHRARV